MVGFERPSSDEATIEARRDALPVARSSTLEYGKFRMREGGASFPDTFWYSLRELRRAGCSTADLRTARDAYEEELAFASEEAMDQLSDEEDEVEGGDSEDGGAGSAPEAEGAGAGAGAGASEQGLHPNLMGGEHPELCVSVLTL